MLHRNRASITNRIVLQAVCLSLIAIGTAKTAAAKGTLQDWQILAQAFSGEYTKDNEIYYLAKYATTSEIAARVRSWQPDYTQRIQWVHTSDSLKRLVTQTPRRKSAKWLLDQWPHFMNLMAITRAEKCIGIGALAPAAESYVAPYKEAQVAYCFSLDDAFRQLAETRVIESDGYGRYEERGLTIVEELEGAAFLTAYAHVANTVGAKLAQDGTRRLGEHLQDLQSGIWQDLLLDMLRSTKNADSTNLMSVRASCGSPDRSSRFYIKNTSKQQFEDVVIVMDTATNAEVRGCTTGYFVAKWSAEEVIEFVELSSRIEHFSPQRTRKPTTINLTIGNQDRILFAGNLVQLPGHQPAPASPDLTMITFQSTLHGASPMKLKADIGASIGIRNREVKAAVETIRKQISYFNRSRGTLNADDITLLESETDRLENQLLPIYLHANTMRQVIAANNRLLVDLHHARCLSEAWELDGFASAITDQINEVESLPQLSPARVSGELTKIELKLTPRIQAKQLEDEFANAIESQLQRITKQCLIRGSRSRAADAAEQAESEIQQLVDHGMLPAWCAEKERALLISTRDRFIKNLSQCLEAGGYTQDEISSRTQEAESAIRQRFGAMLFSE